jgi:tRNA synthetases class I (M)
MSELLVEKLCISTEEEGLEKMVSRHIPVDPSLVDFGAANTNLEGHGSKPYYITTAIAYTNGNSNTNIRYFSSHSFVLFIFWPYHRLSAYGYGKTISIGWNSTGTHITLLGHAYEFITTDALARYHRILGYDTFFLTG